MSIKTFPDRPGGGNENLAIFLAFSAVLHLGLILALAYAPSFRSILKREPKEPPMIVDVVDLPAREAETKRPAPIKDPRFYSDRERRVEEERIPNPAGRTVIVSPPEPRLVPRFEEGVAPRTQAQGGSAQDRPLKAPPAPARPAPPGTDAGIGDTAISKNGPGTPLSKGDQQPKAEAGAGREALARPEPKRPNLFLPRERIAELEKRYQSEPVKPESPKVRSKTVDVSNTGLKSIQYQQDIEINTAELKYYKHLKDLKIKLELYWEYPDAAARNGWQGVVNVDFTINKDGSLGDVKVAKSSNYPVLDEAVITALKLALPIAPIPDEVGADAIHVNGAFRYILLSVQNQQPK